MDEAAVLEYITGTFDGLDIVTADRTTFFFYDPSGDIPPDRRQPFATVVTSDVYDQVSHLDRPGVFRLNIGVSHDTYRALLGPLPKPPGPSGMVETEHDFTALDVFLPHPYYGYLGWVGVLNPDATWPTAKELLTEAHQIAAGRHARRMARDDAEQPTDTEKE